MTIPPFALVNFQMAFGRENLDQADLTAPNKRRWVLEYNNLSRAKKVDIQLFF
jgi:hypothetical protein